MALVSLRETLLPFVITTVAKLSELLSVISFAAPAASVVVELTTTFPESVIAPAAVTESVPLTVEAPRSMALVSLRVTFLPFVITTVAKLSELLSVISFAAPAASVVVELTTTFPESVIAPAAVTESVPLTVEAPRSMALVSLRETLLAETMATVPKLFPPVSVISLAAPAVSEDVPGEVMVPDCVMAPFDTSVSPPEPTEVVAIYRLVCCR